MSHSTQRKRSANVAIDPQVLPRTVQLLARGGVVYGVPMELQQRIGVDQVIRSPEVETRDTEPLLFAKQYLGEHLLSKFDDGKPSPEKEARTWDRFFTAEEACLRANWRLSHPLRLSQTTDISVWSVIETARRKIEWLLGPYREEECARARSFTNGASLQLRKRQGHSAYKYSGQPETTVSNLKSLQDIISFDAWRDAIRHWDSFLVFDGNKVQCVPKNWKTDRTIAIEPTMNMYVQKGIGNVLRRRLKRVAVDLDDQTTNQRHALEGSILNDRATLDLSMASDTVSTEIVYQLLPPDWLSALEQCRSPMGVLPSGKKIVYRKFSSMGNGYTFELESLIFWALAWAVTFLHDGDMSLLGVYGDDLVIDSNVADQLKDVLSYTGFTINDSKSFVKGPFRESCGKHYFNGIDVTPFYIKKPVDSLAELFKLHNRLYRWATRMGTSLSQSDKDVLNDALASIRQYAPASWRRPRIPDGMGDGAFIGTFDECQPSRLASVYRTRKGRYPYAGWEGWLVDVLVQSGDPVSFDLGSLVSSRTGKPVPGEMKTDLDRGYLAYRIAQPSPSGWEQLLFPQEGGGLTLSPRYRVVTILVTHYDSYSAIV